MDFDDDDEDARTRAVRRVHDRRVRTPVTRVARACADRVLVAARMLESRCEAPSASRRRDKATKRNINDKTMKLYRDHAVGSFARMSRSATAMASRKALTGALVNRLAGYTALPHCGCKITLQHPLFVV